MRVQSVRNFFNIGFFLGLFYLLLNLLDFGHMSLFYVFGIQNVSFEVLDLFHLLLSDFFTGSQLVFIGFQDSHCMVLEFRWIAHAVFQKHRLLIDKFNLILDFVVFLFHQLEDVFQSGNFLIFFTPFSLSFNLKCVFFFENHINLYGSSFLSQRLLINFDFLFEFFILNLQLFSDIHGFRQNWEGRLRFVSSLNFEILQLLFHLFYSFAQFILFPHVSQSQGEGKMKSKFEVKSTFFICWKVSGRVYYC